MTNPIPSSPAKNLPHPSSTSLPQKIQLQIPPVSGQSSSAAQRMYEKLAQEMEAAAEQFTASNGDSEMWTYYLKLERMMKMALQMLRLELQQQKAAAASTTSASRQHSPAVQTRAAQTSLPDRSADSRSSQSSADGSPSASCVPEATPLQGRSAASIIQAFNQKFACAIPESALELIRANLDKDDATLFAMLDTFRTKAGNRK